MLDRRWPEWRDTQARLVEAGLPATHEGWKALQDTERAGRAGALPRRLNAKTAAAYVGPHSKAGLTDARRTALAGIEVTRDGIVRLRPNKGLMLERADRRMDASTFVDIAGEVLVNERALRDGTQLPDSRAAINETRSRGCVHSMTKSRLDHWSGGGRRATGDVGGGGLRTDGARHPSISDF